VGIPGVSPALGELAHPRGVEVLRRCLLFDDFTVTGVRVVLLAVMGL